MPSPAIAAAAHMVRISSSPVSARARISDRTASTKDEDGSATSLAMHPLPVLDDKHSLEAIADAAINLTAGRTATDPVFAILSWLDDAEIPTVERAEFE